MEKSTNTKIHGKNNATAIIIPFPEPSPIEQEMDALVCSLCENNEFLLIDNLENNIACNGCGFIVTNTWKHND